MRLQKYINEEQSKYEDIIDILKKDCALFLKELKQTRKKQFLYRGYKYASGIITKKKSRQDREPKDMDDTTSEYLNGLFKKKFGWYARSAGVFATSKTDDAEEYGKPFFFFPIGKYKYIWSPKIGDLYTKIDNYKLSLENVEEMFSEEYYTLLHDDDLDGIWEYDGIDLQIDGDKYEAMQEVLYNKEMFGIEGNIDNNLLEFIPDLTLEDFIDKKVEEIKYDIENLVSTYTNKNLKQAIQIENEITFNCKEYYLVDHIKPGLEKILIKEFF